MQKEATKQQEMVMLQMKTAQNIDIKNRRNEERRKVQEAIYLSKQEEGKQTKIQMQQNEQKRKHMDFKLDTENRMKNSIVNQQKRLAAQKVAEERQRKIQAAQGGQYEKVNNEEQIRLMKEEEVMNMERIEMELIKKL